VLGLVKSCGASVLICLQDGMVAIMGEVGDGAVIKVRCCMLLYVFLFFVFVVVLTVVTSLSVFECARFVRSITPTPHHRWTLATRMRWSTFRT